MQAAQEVVRDVVHPSAPLEALQELLACLGGEGEEHVVHGEEAWSLLLDAAQLLEDLRGVVGPVHQLDDAPAPVLDGDAGVGELAGRGGLRDGVFVLEEVPRVEVVEAQLDVGSLLGEGREQLGEAQVGVEAP